MSTSRTRIQSRLVVGGESRVDLLPPEVSAKVKARSTRRALAGVVVIAILVCGAGYALAAGNAAVSAGRLAIERDKTAPLLQQQAAFVEVSQVEANLNAVKAARAVGTSTEIRWSPFLAQVSGTLPDGVIVKGVAAEASTPLQSLAVPSAPLQGHRVATVVLDVSSPTVPDVQRWLTALAGIPGFVDAVPGSITQVETGGYAVNLTLHLNEASFAHRFDQLSDAAASTNEG